MKSKNKKALEQFTKRFESQIPGEIVLGPMTVSKLNPDGTQTKLGVAHNSEELDQFLPKLPPVNKTLYAHCITSLRFELYRWKATRNGLNMRDLPQEDDQLEEAETMIVDLQNGIAVLEALQTGEALVIAKLKGGSK